MTPEVPARDPMIPSMLRVTRVKRETSDVLTLELDASARPRHFSPGQFNMLYAVGVGESAISVSGDPARPARLFHTIRAVGAATRALTTLRRGDEVGVRGPFGRGWPLDAASGRDVIIVAGGLGLAPLRSAIYELCRRRRELGQVSVVCGARTPEQILFRDELARFARKLEVAVTVDTADRSWTGHTGVVTKLLPRMIRDPARTTAFVCGPEIMMRFAAHELSDLGVRGDQIHVSLERNMKCGVGHCGHCQLGPTLICRDGPVFAYEHVAPFLHVREL